MALFDLSRKKKPSISPAKAGAVLDACARIGISERLFQEIDRKYLNDINTLIYFTKLAIIIHWLRLFENNDSDPKRIKDVLEEFEHLIFSALPIGGQLTLVENIQKLSKQTTELREIIESKSIPGDDIARRMLLWTREWLSFLSDDEVFLNRVSLLYGISLISYVNESIGTLGKKIEEIVYERGIP